MTGAATTTTGSSTSSTHSNGNVRNRQRKQIGTAAISTTTSNNDNRSSDDNDDDNEKDGYSFREGQWGQPKQQRRQSKLLDNLQHFLTSNGTYSSAGHISDDLKAYFQDPLPSNSTREYNDHNDDDVSEWTIHQQHCNNLSWDNSSFRSSTRDDIYSEDSLTEQRRSSLQSITQPAIHIAIYLDTKIHTDNNNVLISRHHTVGIQVGRKFQNNHRRSSNKRNKKLVVIGNSFKCNYVIQLHSRIGSVSVIVEYGS
jgi:hypothetical protein